MMGDLTRLLNTAEIEIQDSKVTPGHLNELIRLIEDATISGKIAKSVLDDAFASGKMPKEIVSEKGLAQITDTSEIEAIVLQIVEENPGPAQDYRDRHEKSDWIPCRTSDARHSRKGKPATRESDFDKGFSDRLMGSLLKCTQET